jgi:hypothetical protein
MTQTESPRRSGEPATVRVAMWSSRHRWPVAAAWFAVTGLGELPLSAGRGADSAGWRWEDGKEGVAFSADLAAVALGDRRPQDGIVPFVECAVAHSKLLQQPGRALHIGE